MSVSTVFGFTGGLQRFVVPAGVTEISFDIFAPSGGGPVQVGFGDFLFGLGGRCQGTLPVQPGDVLDIAVAGHGGATGSLGAGLGYLGYYGGYGSSGGAGGIAQGGSMSNIDGYAGGGCCAVGRAVNPSDESAGYVYVCAGSGGGAAGGANVTYGHGLGGNGGDLSGGSDGGDGHLGTGGGGATYYGGQGGQTSTGGAGGVAGPNSGTGFSGSNGGGVAGGAGASDWAYAPASYTSGGGGGGGGNWGGGGGATGFYNSTQAYGVVGGGGGGGSAGYTLSGPADAPTITSCTPGGVVLSQPPYWDLENPYDGQITISYDPPPDAPTVLAPSGSFDQTQPLLYTASFKSQGSGDFPTNADLQWRIGGGDWNVETNWPFVQALVNGQTVQQHTDPGNTWSTFSGQQIEMQIRFYGSTGTAGAWSLSFFVTPTLPPTIPTITGSPTITSQTPDLPFTTPDTMLAYEYRILADNVGNPGSVLYDSGQIGVPGGPVSYTATLAPYSYVNGTKYHLQIRYQHTPGVWSLWADTGPLVANILVPLVPIIALVADPSTASFVLTIENPPDDPNAPDHNDVFRTDLTHSQPEIKIASVPLNSTYIDARAGFNTTYRYRVQAVTPAGAYASSE